MSWRKSQMPQLSDMALLSSFYDKVSVLGEQVDNLDNKVNLLLELMKRINMQLEDFAKNSKKKREKWIPDASISNSQIDFEKLIKNIEELNLLARFDEHHIQHTSTGASFKLVEHIPLTLYADGLVVSDGRLRPYSGNGTKSFLRDIMDGFFPAELQHQHPEGVIFQVIDKRNKLSGERPKPWREMEISKNLQEPAMIHHKENGTEKVSEEFQSLQHKFPSGKNEITIKILSHNGDKACTLQLSSTETKVGYLLRQLANGENARLLVGYPSKPLTVWNDSILDAQSTPTLAECGITENSILRLQFHCEGNKNKKSKKSPFKTQN